MEGVSKRIENLNPLTKLLAILVFGMATCFFPNPILGFILLFLLMILAFILRLLAGFSKMIFGFGVPLTIMLVFIQGFYSPQNTQILFDFGFAQLGFEGTMYALKLVSVLLVFMGTFFLMNQTTKTSKLVAALEKSGLSPKIGYLVLASFNVVPQMNRRLKEIREAQEARGVVLKGNIFHRVKTFVPLIGPIVLSSFTDAQERGMTLETRGFAIEGVKRTSLVITTTDKLDYIVRYSLLLFLLLVIINNFR